MWSPTISSDELWHHGIKGQKWGDRNGPPYPLDASDHSAREKKAGYTTSIRSSGEAPKIKKHNEAAQTWINNTSELWQEKYNLSKDKADELAEKDWETTKKVLMGAAIVAGIGITAYGIHYIKKNNLDEVISAGTTLQTLSKDPDRLKAGEQFYTSFKDKDKNLYQAWFSKSNGEYKNAIQAHVEQDMKIASRGTSEKIFKDLMKNDPEFKEAVSTGLGLNGKYIPGVRTFKSSYTRNVHDAFNTHILPLDDSIKTDIVDLSQFNPNSRVYRLSENHNKSAQIHNAKVDALFNARKKYYDTLLAKGYSGVIDINDQWYSNLRGDAPAIIFDKSKLGEQTVKQLSSKDIQQIYHNNFNPSKQALINQLMTQNMGDIARISGGAVISSTLIPDVVYDSKAKNAANEDKKRKGKK